MRLNYREYGKDGPVLMILHGLLGSSQNWHSVATELAEQYRIITPDLRNHGESPHANHSIELMSQDVLELADRLDLPGFFLLGHSMGGLAAMDFVFSHGEHLRGLMIEDITPMTEIGDSAPIFEALSKIKLTEVKTRTDADDQLSEHLTDAGVRQFLLQNLKRNDDGAFTWRCNLPELQRFVQSGDGLALAANRRYEGPTLFIGGGRSEYKIDQKRARISEYFPNSEIIMIANAGHWVHFEARSEFVRVVADFVEKHSGDDHA